MDDSFKESLNHGYICTDCARKLGASFPAGHICTWHNGKCDFCSEKSGLCHTSDWDWPNNLRYLSKNREI